MVEIIENADLQSGTITNVQMVGEGSFTLPDGRIITELPAFCRVAVLLKPTPQSNIQAEI